LKKIPPAYIAIIGGLLLFAAWPVSPLTLLIFVAWMPLLWLESTIASRKKFFWLTYLTMFIWNVATTWWIWNASAPGAVAAFLANSLLMCFPWLGYKIVKKKWGTHTGYISLITFWMCFEFIHLQDWGLSWPWLTLGNAFATHPQWVQWYEYTGSSGGTLWILLINIFFFHHVKNNYNREAGKSYSSLLAGIAILFVPIGLSLVISRSAISKKENEQAYNIVVVQPNIDPYEKISTGTFDAQLQTLISTSEKEIDNNTALVIWPETALYMDNGGINEEELTQKNNFLFNALWGFLKKHPGISLFTGVESFRMFDSATRYSKEYSGKHYESYNGAVLLDSAGASAFYHKTMLVPGVETLPWFLKFIATWFEKFGGTMSGYAKQPQRTVLHEKHGYAIAPSICYESVYGEFMSRYVRNGANLICIITNDGWWKKTPGHKQHMNYARLRAIETRTWVARSANTGISCFIDPYGTVYNPQAYDTNAAIKLPVAPAAVHQTFFVQYGDILSRIMVALSMLIICWRITVKVLEKYFKKKFPALQEGLPLKQ
jgi:apolipoprotein N-acyltransferase